MWPFTSRETGDAVRPFPHSHDTDTYAKGQSGEEAHYPGSDISSTVMGRVRDNHYALQKREARTGVMDIESINCLLPKYGAELEKAEEAMTGRRSEGTKLSSYFYDYDNDKRYAVWREDFQRSQERLKIHWLDICLDRWLTGGVYMLRVYTTAGLFYGMGRTAYLYHTMDKPYAKLNGVSLGSIAFNEVTQAVAKGGAAAVGGLLGINFGLAIACLASTATSDGCLSFPDRQWWHLPVAGIGSGLGAGAVLTFLHRETLTGWGRWAVVGGLSAASGVVGLYLGYVIYRPYASTRERPLYEPYWRPWQYRYMRRDVDKQHGRYM